jgi:hypothetical protein
MSSSPRQNGLVVATDKAIEEKTPISPPKNISFAPSDAGAGTSSAAGGMELERRESVMPTEHMLSDVTQVVGDALEDVMNVGSYWSTDALTDDIAGPAGALVFTLHKGVDLLSADRNGLSDPYCIVKVHSSPVWRSKVIYKTLNPVWNQSHDFEGYLEDQITKPLKIKVYDFDVLSLNDPIGRCQVDISGLKQYGKENGLTFTDVPLTGVAHGSISFDVHFELKPVFARARTNRSPSERMHKAAQTILFY